MTTNHLTPQIVDKVKKYIPNYSFTVGKTIIDFTPSGMWGHYVWQSTAPFICSGIQRVSDDENMYRFTQIGDSSIKLPGQGYADIEISQSEINKTRISKILYSSKNYEIKIIGGWVKLKDNYNKKVFRQRTVL